MKLLLSLSVLLLLTAVPAFAEEEQKKENEVTPITEWIDAENALLETLPAQNKKIFFILRNKHSVIRTVGVVKRDVGNAVKACGKENPDLKKPIRDRFKDWESAVSPVLKEAEKFLEIELKEQEAFHVSDYRHVTKLNDKAYKFSESKIEKTPVTEKESCERLLQSMDRTEDKLIGLLQDILLPEEVIRTRLDQGEKAQ